MMARSKTQLERLFGKNDGKTGLEMLAMDNVSLNNYQGLNTSDEELGEPTNLIIWQ